MKENKKSFSEMVGRFISNMLIMCISTCILAAMVAITYAIVSWIFKIGGLI